MAHPNTKESTVLKQTYVRLPDDIEEEIRAIAEQEHWSFNTVMLEAAKLIIAKHKQGN
jgi:hypothetical protein